MLTVTYFYREPRKTGYSIEGIFQLINSCLKDKVSIKEFYCNKNKSRLLNTLNVRKFASEINHITGDVNFLALGLIGKKNILTVHDMGHYDTLRKKPITHFIYKNFWYHIPLKYIDIVTVVSEFTKEKLIEYTNYPESKIRIITDPVKPIFSFFPKERRDTLPKILMMGTGKHKNLNNLIEAAQNLALHIDIIGFPSTEELLKLEKYKISHSIYQKLSDEEVNQRYRECDILYNASFYEGFGMPIIEAQSVGRPVICSNIGAMKEVANNSAAMVNPKDVGEIRQAINRLINDREFYENNIKKGRENIQHFQYKIIAQQYLDVYLELAEKRK